MNKPKGGGNRLNRINEELKREISNIINYEVTNSNVTGMVSNFCKNFPRFKICKS